MTSARDCRGAKTVTHILGILRLQHRGIMAVNLPSCFNLLFFGSIQLKRKKMMSRGTGKAQPTGLCWCGCGGKTNAGKYFIPGHDRKAEAALVKMKYGNIAGMLAHHGFCPETSVRKAAERND